jgi:2-oxoglutarate dehydrogenase E2 component (dihydrolipoamide succinyltransferase)
MPIELKVPQVGESITEVQIGEWLKSEGEHADRDEAVVVIESEKATFELPSPVAGVIQKVLKKQGEMARIGEVIGHMVEGQEAPAAKPGKRPKSKGKQAGKDGDEPEQEQETKGDAAGRKTPDTTRIMPAARRALATKGLEPSQVEPTGPGGRMLKEDVLRSGERRAPARDSGPPHEEQDEHDESDADQDAQDPPDGPSAAPAGARPRGAEEIVAMSLLRRRIAERLVQAKQNAALLTTFNEIDMSEVKALRAKHRDAYQQRFGVKLGFMSFFVKAAIDALKLIPQVNAEVRGTDIAYRNYYDIGIAVGGGKGLVVPVLRNAERLSFAEIEKLINDFGRRAEQGKLVPDELKGGTFTISNGGVYGSLLSTPIVNPPQSGILGLHAIQDRPVAREGQVVIRPMMYVALTYDHRIVDGREAVTFLKRIKECVEDPARMLLEV